MMDREIYALEMNLLEEIRSSKLSWHKVLKIFELNAIAERH